MNELTKERKKILRSWVDRSCSFQARSHTKGQEIPNDLWNQKIYCSRRMCPTLFPFIALALCPCDREKKENLIVTACDWPKL